MHCDRSTYNKALRYSLKVLSIRPRSKYELVHKLREKKYAEHLIEGIVHYLEDESLLNDKEFIQAFIAHHRTHHPYGRQRLRYELKKRGISQATIDEELRAISYDDELNRAYHVAEQRFMHAGAVLPKRSRTRIVKIKKRIYDYLCRRGFDRPIARQVIERLPVHMTEISE